MHRRLFQSEFARFLLVGFTAVAIDFACYRLLLAIGMPIAPAKACGYIAGAVFGYFANRIFSFRVEAAWHWRETARFVAVYLSALLANIAVNALVIHVAGRGEIAIVAAFLAATAVSATLNYLGMKYLVFAPAKPPVPQTP